MIVRGGIYVYNISVKYNSCRKFCMFYFPFLLLLYAGNGEKISLFFIRRYNTPSIEENITEKCFAKVSRRLAVYLASF